MTLLIHRVKTDLTVDHASSFQLAAIKHLLQAIRSRSDAEIRDVGSRLADLKARGAAQALAIDQRLSCLK